MPTDDRQVLVTGTASTPASFTVPGNGQIQPKAVNAVFDGTGAASAFLPALEIVSDAGVVVARCPAPAVAAGGSASVSWFPHVESALPTPNTGGLWTPYTPVWSQSGGAQPTLGNGTLTGVYYQIGSYVACQILLRPGGTTTYGDPNPAFVWEFSLPVTAAVATISNGMASNCFDLSAGSDFVSWGFQASTTQMAGWAWNSTAAAFNAVLEFVSAQRPITWASGDTLRLSCIYEAA